MTTDPKDPDVLKNTSIHTYENYDNLEDVYDDDIYEDAENLIHDMTDEFFD